MVSPLSQIAQGQNDSQELLPPVAADHSLAAAKIRAALASNDYPAAQTSISGLIEQSPNEPEGYFWQGLLKLQSQNYTDAVLSFRDAQKRGGNTQALKLLALSYYFLGQFRLFTTTAQEAIGKDPQDFAPYYYLGRYYASTDAMDFVKASGYFRAALQRKPDHYSSHYYLGYCEESTGKPQDAEVEYQHSLEIAETAQQQFAPPYQGLARLKLLSRQPEEALPFAGMAVKIDASDPAGHEILARVYADLDRKQEAAKEWQRAAELEPSNPKPPYRLYRLYLQLGEKQKAEESLKNYKSLVAIYGSD
jgi:tetratricopeptide (TPR) repeat protein